MFYECFKMSLLFGFNSLNFSSRDSIWNSEEILFHSSVLFRKMKQHWQERQRAMLLKCRNFISITTKSICKLCRVLLINMTGWFSERMMSSWLLSWRLALVRYILFDIKFMFLTQCPTYKSISNCCCPIWGFEGCKSDRSCWSGWWGETECILYLTPEWYQVIGTCWKWYIFVQEPSCAEVASYICGCDNYFLCSVLLW